MDLRVPDLSVGKHASKGSGAKGVGLVALAILILIGVAAFVLTSEDTADVSRNDTSSNAPIVSVLAIEAAEASATVTALAELRPRWKAEIRASVSGRIRNMYPAALSGARVAKGAPLLDIESSAYEASVAQARLTLEEAQLTQLRARNQVTLARKQFQRDGVAPPSDLALHLPELRIADRSVAAAQAQLAAAQQQLADTTVTAPFSGFVINRMASLGQTVSPGEALLTLSDNTYFELEVGISQADWALLERPIVGQAARLFHRDGRALGSAKIREGGGFLDPKTRQLRIFLDVSDPPEGLLSGDFLRVEFEGRKIADTLTLPDAALTRAGRIWLVNDQDQLVRYTPNILFRGDGTLTISRPDLPAPWLVAQTPLAAFLPGQRVRPQLVGE